MVVVALTLVGAGVSARAGLDTLEEVRAGASTSSLASPQPIVRLRDAEAHFRTARAWVRSLAVSPLRALPVIGRQLRSADHLREAAGEVAGTTADALDEVRGGWRTDSPPVPIGPGCSLT